MTHKILVAGAGIGGLTAALSLAKAGHDVEILERAHIAGEVGAGLQLSANALKVLEPLGTVPALEKLAFEPERAVIRDGQSGKEKFSLPLKGAHEDRYGHKFLHLHRADLHLTLLKACEEVGVSFRMKAEVFSYLDVDGGVSVTLKDGRSVHGDLLIGADGVRSVIRSQMTGSDGPQFTGQTAWRGLVPAAALPEGTIPPDATVWTGDGRHLVTYYVRRGELINFVAVLEREEWCEESWWQEGDLNELRAAFSGWDPRITSLLSTATRSFYWGLFGHPPLPRWSEGRVTLLGDAAHPMLPFMAQGAVMAIEDAAILTRSLTANRDDIPAALKAYEQKRLPRATMIQKVSRDNAATYHAPGGMGRLIRDIKLRTANAVPEFAWRRFDPIYDWSPETA